MKRVEMAAMGLILGIAAIAAARTDLTSRATWLPPEPSLVSSVEMKSVYGGCYTYDRCYATPHMCSGEDTACANGPKFYEPGPDIAPCLVGEEHDYNDNEYNSCSMAYGEPNEQHCGEPTTVYCATKTTCLAQVTKGPIGTVNWVTVCKNEPTHPMACGWCETTGSAQDSAPEENYLCVPDEP